MAFNYNKLRGRIREVFGTQDKFAKAMGMANSTLSLKLNNCTEFTQQEMYRALELLHEPHHMVNYYFFTLEVREVELKG
jgi:hypothetical protein